jgi:Leucine-rich repeat (LRR) protein
MGFEEVQERYKADPSNPLVKNMYLRECFRRDTRPQAYLDQVGIPDTDMFSLDYWYFEKDPSITQCDYMKGIFNPILKDMGISDTSLESLDFFELFHAPNLATLDLHGNKLKCLKGIRKAYLPELRQLYLSRNKIENISDLVSEGFEKLEYLAVNDNQDISLKGFPNLPSLKGLGIASCKVRSASELSDIQGPLLKSIDLSDNLISSFKEFEQLNFPNLRKIFLSVNKFKSIRDIGYLNKFKRLKLIFLRMNEIESLDGIEDLDLKELKRINLMQTPVGQKPLPRLSYEIRRAIIV